MILVTGGTGYIGSHTVVELLQAGHDVLIFDNLSNSKLSVLGRIEQIAGRKPGFVEGDIRDRAALKQLFAQHKIDAVIHFAGLKAVGESVAQPLRYYDNNFSGSVALFETMADAGVKQLVFSSSATVYGDPASVPIRSRTCCAIPIVPIRNGELSCYAISIRLVRTRAALLAKIQTAFPIICCPLWRRWR
jgi:UDP-glucose 4-epimerase